MVNLSVYSWVKNYKDGSDNKVTVRNILWQEMNIWNDLVNFAC